MYTAGFRVKDLEHDVLVTHVLVPFIRDGIEVTRGRDDPVLPDAKVQLLEPVHIELDMGTVSREKMQSRIALYAKRDELVVWISPDEGRDEWIRSLCKPIRKFALFATLEECHLYWRDYNGKELEIYSLIEKVRDACRGNQVSSSAK